MSASSASESKSLKILFITAFVLAAAAGGWALGRMGADRDRAKAEAEKAVTTGTGTVKEAAPVAPSETKPAETPTPAAPVVPAESKPTDAPTPAALVVPAETKPAEAPTPASLVVPAETKPAEAPAPTAKPVGKAPESVTPAEPPAKAEETVPVEPPKLILHSVPAAEITLKNNTGFEKTYVTDTKGDFRSEVLPEGVYEIAVNHRDYKPLATPTVFELKAGETTETTVRPESKPASLVVVADSGSTVFLDGTKVGGGGAVMLGSVASRHALALKIVPVTGETRTETITLEPRESRLLDVRTPEGIARAKAEAEAEAAATAPAPDAGKPSAADAARLAAIAEQATPGAPANAEKTGPATNNPVTKPGAIGAPVSLAVKVISADAAKKLVAFTGPDSGVAPMATGKAGALKFAEAGATTIVIKCVRTFGGVSVCEASDIPAVTTPADGVATF